MKQLLTAAILLAATTAQADDKSEIAELKSQVKQLTVIVHTLLSQQAGPSNRVAPNGDEYVGRIVVNVDGTVREELTAKIDRQTGMKYYGGFISDNNGGGDRTSIPLAIITKAISEGGVEIVPETKEESVTIGGERYNIVRFDYRTGTQFPGRNIIGGGDQSAGSYGPPRMTPEISRGGVIQPRQPIPRSRRSALKPWTQLRLGSDEHTRWSRFLADNAGQFFTYQAAWETFGGGQRGR